MQYTSCTTEPNTQLDVDPRYDSLLPDGADMNELMMLEGSSVGDQLLQQPAYNHFVRNQRDKRKVKLQLWARPTIPWKLSCEAEGQDRAFGYQLFSTKLETSPIT